MGTEISLGQEANTPAPPGGRTVEAEAGQTFSFNAEIRDEYGNLTDIDEACTLCVGVSIPRLFGENVGAAHSMCSAKRTSMGIFRCRFGVTRSGLFHIVAEIRPSGGGGGGDGGESG